MTTISVRALPGRVVYDAPRGGKRIPSDKYVKVQDSHYIRRLADVWGDIELESAKPAAKPAPAPASAQAKPVEAPKA